MVTRSSKRPTSGAAAPGLRTRLNELLIKAWPYLGLLALTWLAHFWLSGRFGLYEDDFTLIPSVMALDRSHLLGQVIGYATKFGGYPRPLQGASVILLSYISYHLGGLRGIYLIAWLMVSLNVLLFYGLLRRLGGSSFAMLGAVAFVLFPADTTRAFLTHALGLQLSLTFLLLALHAYQSKHEALSYVLISLTLLTYETTFVVLLAAPFLAIPWDRRLPRKLGIHFVVMAALLGGDYLLLLAAGDSRVAGLTLLQALWTPIRQMLVGPLVGFGAYFHKAGKLLLHLDPVLGLTAAVAAAALVALFRRLESDGASGKPGLRLAALPQTLRQMARAERDPSDGTAPKAVQTPAHWLKLALVGLLMLILAYPLTFTTTPVALVGRGTRVHFAGVVGAGLLWAGLGELALAIGRGYRLAGWVRLAMALVFGLSLSYDLSVQRDYARAWTLERTFWQGVLPLAPDIQDGTMVLVGGTPLPETLQIGANTWALPRILGEMFIFPADWRTPPRVYRLVPDWKAAIPSGADRFRLDGNVVIRPPWLVAEAVPSNTILLQRGADGRLSRLTSVDIGSRTYDLKPKGVSSLTSHPTTPLYHLLMDDSDMSGDR